MPSPSRRAGRSSRSRIGAEARRLVSLLNDLGGTIFRQLLWQKAAELELTYAQSQVLYFVAEHPGCHMGDVAKAFGVTLPAITHIVDRLEQRRYVVRGTHPGDRRVALLEVTPAGAALAGELRALQLVGVESVLSRMTARDRASVLRGLEALGEAAAGEVTRPARRGGGRSGSRGIADG